MMISAPSRLRPEFGRGAGKRLTLSTGARLRLGVGQRLLTAMLLTAACCGLACSDDDPAQETGIGGSAGSSRPDASVRDLPGDGREPTPEFDTDSRQRTPIGPQELVDTIEDIRNDIDGRGPGDAGSGNAGAGNAGAGNAGTEDGGPGSADAPDGGAN